MTFGEYINTLSGQSPPDHVHDLLKALWYDAKGNWSRAHAIAQGVEGADGAWVHAYLHRKEDDHSNASYWYRRTGKKISTIPLSEEWENIARELLTASR